MADIRRATNSGLPLPEACAHKVLTFLPAKHILRTAAASRAFRTVAHAPEVWLNACKAKWPDVSQSEALARAARTRGPMVFYRRRSSVERGMDTTQTPPLCELDDLLFVVVMEQGDTQLCSVAVEARGAMRRSLPQTHYGHPNFLEGDQARTDGICLEGLDARVRICPERNEFPPSPRLEDEETVYFTMSVVRKSDGLVSALVPRQAFHFGPGGGYAFNDPVHMYEDEQLRYFAANPNLKGFLAFHVTTPEDPEGDGILNVGNQLNAPPSDWSTAKLLEEMHQQFQRLSVNVPQINCTMTLGCWEEFPLDGLQPETWEPSSDPSVVIGPDYVEIRRINVSFGMYHGTLRTRDSDSDTESFDGGVSSFRSKVDLDGLHRLLSERLRFA
jgi:hypothetical protein